MSLRLEKLFFFNEENIETKYFNSYIFLLTSLYAYIQTNKLYSAVIEKKSKNLGVVGFGVGICKLNNLKKKRNKNKKNLSQTKSKKKTLKNLQSQS